MQFPFISRILRLEPKFSFISSCFASRVQGHGKWIEEEKTEYISVLQLKLAMLSVLILCCKLHDCHIRIELDNTTVVCYINNMVATHLNAINLADN